MRVVLALLIAVGGVVAVSVLAAGASRAGRGGGDVGAQPIGEALDALVMALLTLGLALTIAVFIVQFGGERKEKEQSTKRRLIGALLVPVLLVGVLWLVQRIELDIAGFAPVAEETPPPGSAGGSGAGALDDEEVQDRSTVGTWTGIAFGLLILGVGSAWMWAERRRRALEESDDLRAVPGAERDRLAGLLDDAIDDLRDDPDPRRAVIRAWGRLDDALSTVGVERHEAEAPFPYLARALDALDTSGPAAERLTDAFEAAMFSGRPVDRAMQLEAVDALVAVRDELRVTTA